MNIEDESPATSPLALVHGVGQVFTYRHLTQRHSAGTLRDRSRSPSRWRPIARVTPTYSETALQRVSNSDDDMLVSGMRHSMSAGSLPLHMVDPKYVLF